MNVFLAATMCHQKTLKEYVGLEELRSVYLLESFYYMRSKKDEDFSWCSNSEKFLLDSGAFTFMSNSKLTSDWNKYVDEYAEFINRYDIKYFFELDIDCVTGIKKVESLRDRLESLTGKKSIPVWHLSRGKKYYEWMCKNYPYVAFGGIITDGLSSKTLEKYFNWFISTAHKNGTRIHGLGYTSTRLNEFHFDSVDSTSWLTGNKFGKSFKFSPEKGSITQVARPEGTKIRNYKELLSYNFIEWLKFQKYAETNL